MGHTDTPTEFKLSELFDFFPKQAQARDACFTHRFVLYGGARGGGKSRWLRWMLLFLLLYWFFVQHIKNVRVGLFCSTYPELRDRQIGKINDEFPPWLGVIKETKEDGLCFFLRPQFGGGKIALRNLDDPNKYKSGEFAAIAVDELTLLPEKSVFDILRGSLRWPGIAHTVFLAATNPDGVGNLWVRELWIERQFPPEMQEIMGQFVFIQSLPADNKFLDEQYWADLRSQPRDVQRAWIEGDWYVFSGQAIPLMPKHIIKPCEIPVYWVRKSGYDWGYAKPFAYVWGARNPDNGRWIIYREAYGAGFTDPRQAEMVKQMEPAGERLAIRYADPSVWSKKTYTADMDAVRQPSTAEVFSGRGLYLTPANNDRLAGKRKLTALLEPLPDGLPGLLVFETCTNIRRTLPSLVYDKAHVEDIDTEGEDHAYDALRYMLTDDIAQQVTTRRQRQPAPITQIKGL